MSVQHDESHPVLGRSRALRDAVEKHGLVCLDSTYRGLKAKHRFACDHGHVTSISPRNLIRQREIGCRECAQIAATARMHHLAQKVNSVALNAMWRGTAARYRFRCNSGHTWSCLGLSLLRGAACTMCAALNGQSKGTLLLDGLERLRDAAAQHGGVCLSKRYGGMQAIYKFRCTEGHTWQTQGATVLYHRSWCAQCARDRKHFLPDGLERLQDLAAQRGGRCLSERFEGSATKHRFECANGHRWDALAGALLYSGNWCRRCMYDHRRSSDGLVRLHAAAQTRGGRCLADRYDGVLAQYVFECAEGHQWQAAGGRVLRGSWCRQCADARVGDVLRHSDGLAMLQAKAADKGGECLDGEYLGTHRRHRFRCSEGHEWAVKAGNILRGSWCARCGIERQRLTIEDARRVAHERGGVCLSGEYVNARSRLIWQCHRGHVWQANLDNVKNKGKWCPNCAFLQMAKNPEKRLKWDFEGKS
ncbi:hypothetical protein [Burkholderia sp. LMG 32019]|uniref:hypothetical protein n=1 Tax=Burkholderia sp. LMG 32019 TaxID=3158173 RepID=UPI003C2ADE32